MMGVVLWSNLNENKAVFWCEDQGDLAFYDASNEKNCEEFQFQPGDLVQFDLTSENKIRRANRARVVEQKVCKDIQDALRKSASKTGEDGPAPVPNNVIPIHRPAAVSLPAAKRAINS